MYENLPSLLVHSSKVQREVSYNKHNKTDSIYFESWNIQSLGEILKWFKVSMIKDV